MHFPKWKKSNQKKMTYHMIPFIWQISKRKINPSQLKEENQVKNANARKNVSADNMSVKYI